LRVLVIEDEAKVARALKEGLEGEGYETRVARSGEEGLALADSMSFDLVLLDLMLPGKSGVEVLGALRRRSVGLPVLILTARDAIEDRVDGLDGGADDYLVKPFAFAELLARMRALLRRGRPEATLHPRFADLELDMVSRTASRRGTPLDLTTREFELLEFLVRHGGEVVSREMLAHGVWKEKTRSEHLDNVIDVYVARLRRKLDRDDMPGLLHTVRGVGLVLGEERP
jgi:DNA-binding response OmpR family regulator